MGEVLLNGREPASRPGRRCGRPLRYHALNRLRDWVDLVPACGRPAGHGPADNPDRGCMSEEAYARSLVQHKNAKAARRAAGKG